MSNSDSQFNASRASAFRVRRAYVGLTRAQDELHVLYMQPVGFVSELKKAIPAGVA